MKLRVIGRSQQLLRVDFEEEPDHEVLEDMLALYEQTLAVSNVVLFSDYGKGGLTHIPRMIELARSAGKPVLIDPKGSDYSRYAGATVITPNRAELAQVIGALVERGAAARACAGAARAMGTRRPAAHALRGRHVAVRRAGHMQVPAQAREVFDVTGAGDTVIATLAAMLAAA